MTLNASGPISLAGTTAGQSIEIENGGNGTTMISLNDTAVRTLAGVPSGAIVMPTNFYGKSNRVSISFTYTSSTADAALNTSGIGGYSSGKSDITVTINSGVYLYATSTGNYGLNLTGATTGDTLSLVNNGYIIGQGGNGGPGGGGAGGAAGPALNVGTGINITVNNTNGSAYIGGGGGGGANTNNNNQMAGGGGAGGGTGGSTVFGDTGGAGGGIGSSGGNGTTSGSGCCVTAAGGGGGRILPGTGGTAPRGGGGAGGAGGAGDGGSANAAGAGCGGGGWGASGGAYFGYPGGAGGKAVNLNGKTVTWTSGDTTRVWGTVS